ncbi:MAG TPA: sigma-70 family RNA polymerase sigma factor [Mariprofundaceae bacterium]|nr:sigma-70 family RNA polymerase sigma factor [Mariprofundaceae bacterium]
MFSSKTEAYKVIEAHYRANAKRLVKQLTIKSRGVHNAEDIVQDMYTNALTYWRSFNATKASLNTWLMEIMNNAAKDHMTKEKMHGALGNTDDKIVPDETINPAADARLELNDIKRHLLTKRGQTRAILVAALIEQAPYNDIAAQFGINEKAVKQSVWRFREELRNAE